jgi:hypothetical protein
MDTNTSLKTENKGFLKNLARVLVNNHVVIGGTRVLPIKAKPPQDEEIQTFKQYMRDEITSVNGHYPVDITVVPYSYRGFAIDLTHYVEMNIMPPEQQDFGRVHVDMNSVKESFLKRIGGSPALEKTGGELTSSFSLDKFVETYAEEVLYHAREFKKFSIPYQEFDKSIETSVSTKLGINPQQVRYLGQVMRGELVGLDYLLGRDYKFSDVKSLARTLSARCGNRLVERVNWMNTYTESSNPKEPVKSEWIKKYESKGAGNYFSKISLKSLVLFFRNTFK